MVDQFNRDLDPMDLSIPCGEGYHNAIVEIDGRKKWKRNCTGFYNKVYKQSATTIKQECQCRCHNRTVHYD